MSDAIARELALEGSAHLGACAVSAAEHYITAMAPDGDGNIVAACACGYVLFESAYPLPRAFQEHTRGMR